MKFTNVLVAAAIFATTSLFAFTPVFAQECDGACPPPPPPPHGDRMERGERPPHPEHKDILNLTDAQKAQAKTIFQKAQEDKKALLTDEQKAQIKDRMEKRGDKKGDKCSNCPRKQKHEFGKHHHKFGKGLDLTDEQKAKIQKIDEWEKAESKKVITDEQKAKVKEIRKKAHEDRMNVLTDEQKQQMKEMKANRPHGHYGHHGHHGKHHKMHKGNENFRGIELTDDQKAKFKAIDEKARKDFENILTDSQKKALEEQRAEFKNRRQR